VIDQHAQRLERLREERDKALAQGATQKQSFENKFEPCLVCGDRASGTVISKTFSEHLCLLLILIQLYFRPSCIRLIE